MCKIDIQSIQNQKLRGYSVKSILITDKPDGKKLYELIGEQKFVKHARYGNLAHQILGGKVNFNDIPPHIRSVLDGELQSSDGQSFLKFLKRIEEK